MNRNCRVHYFGLLEGMITKSPRQYGKYIHSNMIMESRMYTSNDFPNLSYSSMLRATSQLCETIGSGSFENSLRSAMLFPSVISKKKKIQLIAKQNATEATAKIATRN